MAGFPISGGSASATGTNVASAVACSFGANVSVASAPTTIDGVTPSSGDLVFLPSQTAASQNGPWIYNGSGAALSRPSWFASGSVQRGTSISVLDGTSYLGSGFQNTRWHLVLAPGASVTVDTTAQTWYCDGPLRFLFTSTNAAALLPQGTYQCRAVAGGGAGGGAAAGLSDFSVTLTAYAKPTASSLSFAIIDPLPALRADQLPTISVTGTGITPLVLLENLSGNTVQLIAAGGSIGTLGATSAYTFTTSNSGGGGSAGTDAIMSLASDGTTTWDIVIGAGGTGVSGANGNVGGHTTISGGATLPNVPNGVGGSFCSTTQPGWGGAAQGVAMNFPPGAFWSGGGAGGCLFFGFPLAMGYAANQSSVWSPVGGGAGGPQSGGTNGGTGGGAGVTLSGGGPGTAGGAGGVTGTAGQSASAPNYGCGGGGAGGNATGGSATAGGAGMSGAVELVKTA